MNREQAYALVRQTFMRAFEKGRFTAFAKNLLNHLDETNAGTWSNVKDAFRTHVQRYERLGTYTSPIGEKLDVLVVHLTAQAKLERARTAIRNFVADHLKARDEKDAALVAFVSPSEAQWRFSYVKMEYATVETESGKIGVEAHLTPARRFSYIVGEGESCHTAQARFLHLLQNTDTNPTLADLEAAFSVEAVTKEFFTKYAELFTEINAALANLVAKDRIIRLEFKAKAVNTVDFAKKLMGQVVFLYFLQKKGWLGVPKGGDWGAGPHDFLRRLAAGEYGKHANFFNHVLEPLFYDTLATDRGHLAWCTRLQCRIPFLNGGLFEPLGDYDWKTTDILLPNRLFFNRESVEGDTFGSGVLDVFDRYNFTVNEAEPLEKEVAIDPEMLGKVFENLIEENRRKGTGAYYTPREIVYYMCQQSLINYLDVSINAIAMPVAAAKASQTKLFGIEQPHQTTIMAGEYAEVIPRADIETLVQLGDQISHYEAVETSYRIKMPRSIEQHARLLDEALARITVCDPAVGSGAFPVAMMTEIVRARGTLTPYFNDSHERTPYHFKRHAIQNSLYGVDIDPGAVEIAKLRLWLSLVVDEEDVRQIRPLPNLDYKVVAGDSLLGFPFTSRRLSDLETLKTRFFDESDRDAKTKLKQQIDKTLRDSLAASQKSLGYAVTFDFNVWFAEIFEHAGGFDVVLGNPPYVRVHKQDPDHKRVLRQLYKSPSGDFDIYIVFIEKALLILRPQGVLTFITPDKFLIRAYGQNIRRIILSNRITELYDISRADDAFGAAVYPLISIIQKGLPPAQTRVRFARSVKDIRVPQTEYLYPQDDWRQANMIELVEEADLKVLRKINAGSSTLASLVGDKAIFCGTPRAKDYYEWTKGLVERSTSKTPKVLVCSNLRPYSIDHGKEVRTLGKRIAGPYFDNARKLIGINQWSSFRHTPKILIRGNDRRITAVLDEEPSVFIGIYGIKISAETTRLAKFLVAALNSALYQWVFLTKNPSLKIGGGFFSINAPQILALPFREPSAETLGRVNRAFDEIVAAKRRNAGADTTAREKEVDRLVYKLYGLTPAEISLVESSLPQTRVAERPA